MDQHIKAENEARAFIATLGSSDAIARLECLERLLITESERQNLVAAGSLPHLWQRHFADSAQLLIHVPRETPKLPWMDFGSGAGFPGLVIAAMRPDWQIILVEPRKRRIEWLQSCVESLGLKNCTVAAGRAEGIGPREAGIISARALAPLTDLIKMLGRFSTRSTRWVLPKGRSAAPELASLPARAARMFHVEHSLTDSDAGIIVGTGRVQLDMKR